MIPFLALVRKDLRMFFSDRRAVMISILVPIVLASFLGYLFGGRGGQAETSRIKILVIDQDSSAISRTLITQLTNDKNLDVQPSTVDEARELVRKGKVVAAIVIPKGFGVEAGQALFAGGKKPEIGILYDPSHGMEQGMVQGILTGAVMQSVSKEMFAGQTGRDLMKESLAQIENDNQMPAGDKKILRDLLTSVDKWNEQQAREPAIAQEAPTGGLTVPFETRSEAITSSVGEGYSGYAHSFAGMAVQFILFMGLDVGIRLLLLRQSGLWQRFRAAPLSRTVLLGSRTFSAALISGFILFTLFGFARLVFGVHIRGSFAGFLLVCAAFSLMTAAFGLMIAALGKTVEATRGYAVMATLIMVMLGGSWAPTFIFPQWLQKATVVVPTRWAMDGLEGMTWRGLGFSEALLPVGGMLLFTAVFGFLAVARFRWEAEG
jgi:ABC-2 type transport system permease protein